MINYMNRYIVQVLAGNFCYHSTDASKLFPNAHSVLVCLSATSYLPFIY